MYRCTECNKEYEECPDFCECGNDTFEEVDVEFNDYDEEEEIIPPPKKHLTPREKEELAQEQKEKNMSLIVMGVVAVLLCIVVFVLPPHKKAKMVKVKEKVAQAQVKIPSVNSYWDNSLPSVYKKEDPLANLPLLNSRFRFISPVLREYLVYIGNEFSRKWDKTIINGSGEAKVEFTIDKEGNLDSKRIVSTSNNESLDNSVLLVLSKLNSFDVPPDDYKGERVYITFKINPDKSSQVVYPMK